MQRQARQGGACRPAGTPERPQEQERETQVGTDIKKERAGLWKQDEKAPQGQGLACRP